MSKTLVIVESPAKAKTISRFLGASYDVQASYGHVRDLPEGSDQIPEEFKKEKWARLGVNVAKDYEPIYVVAPNKERHVANLRKCAKGVDRVLLATDEDREGESISWHILQLLKLPKKTQVQRIVFHEITPEAIQEALASPRQVDEDLVKAQETRRILDRLYGYTLSPLLWKKVAPKLSAGRVQSVAVRLIVMRERERRDFVVAGYSSIDAELKSAKGKLNAKLIRIDSARVADGQSFNPQGELENKKDYWLKSEEAQTLSQRLEKSEPWMVSLRDVKPGQENAPPPFMTSTLQQEANRKLGFSARLTMQIAQNLYEGVDIGGERVGLITYMRTDSLTLSERAVTEARQVIQNLYGKEYLPDKPVRYKSKAKNAQEAHEAIRPTELARRPQDVQRHLSDEQFKLYDLIWKRTVACQMKPAQVERTRIEITVPDAPRVCAFGASGKSILFPGFLRAYVEGSDDPEAELGDRETILPEVKQGEILDLQKIKWNDHETRPPARYTEATLVRTLEAEGVGRPSTYASIIGTIQDRGYVFKRRNELVPTFTAFAVTELLEGHFDELVDVRFTARMEEELDEIAEGRRDSVRHLREFYEGVEPGQGLVQQVDTKAPDISFPSIPLGEGVTVRIGRNGPFIQRGEGGKGNTASVPEELPPADLTYAQAIDLLDARAKGPESIGTDPATGRQIFHKKGRFGDYLEMEAPEGEDPKRVTVPPDAGQLTDEDLGILFSYPKVLGKNPDGDDVNLLIGRYGAYLKAGTKNANIGDWRAAATLDLAGALAAIESGGNRRGRTAAAPVEPIKVIGAVDGIEGEVKVLSGRYGPYVSNGTVHATLPKGIAPTEVTASEASELLKAKIAAGGGKKKPAKRGFKKKKA